MWLAPWLERRSTTTPPGARSMRVLWVVTSRLSRLLAGESIFTIPLHEPGTRWNWLALRDSGRKRFNLSPAYPCSAPAATKHRARRAGKRSASRQSGAGFGYTDMSWPAPHMVEYRVPPGGRRFAFPPYDRALAQAIGHRIRTASPQSAIARLKDRGESEAA